MAAVREELVLVDRFSSVFSAYLNLGRQIASNMRVVTETQNGFTEAAVQSREALENMAGAGDRAADSVEETSNAARKMANASRDAADRQHQMNRAMRDGAHAADGLVSKLKALAAAYLGLRSAQAFVNLSDTWAQTTARLDRMNDGQQTTPQVQDMIFNAAQRSRGDYQDTADMVAKLGTLAPDAFGSTAEVVAFAEQINKQFALAGTSAQGAQAAMLQLTQAMASGVLRGEELNSVLEQAPTITQAIAKYMGVSIGELRELASEGQVTAQVVKAAMFAAAEETNAAFEAVPLTFSQAWTMVKNEALNALRPALEQLNELLNSDIGHTAFNGLIAAAQMAGQAVSWLISMVEMGAQWVMDNWETVSTVLIGLAAGVAAVMIGSAVASAAAWIAANWPLVLIVGTIALVIYMVKKMGATWEEIGGVVGGVLGLMYAFVMNVFIVPAYNAFAFFGNFVGNFLRDPISAVKILFMDLAVYALGKISDVAHGMENLVNKIPGVSVNLTSGIDNLYNKVKDAAQSARDKSGWVEYFKPLEYVGYGDAWNSWSNKGKKLGKALDEFSLKDVFKDMGGGKPENYPGNYEEYLNNSGIANQLEGIGGDTKAIRSSVALSEEDIKLLADLAERDYITNVNLTAQTPIINVSGQNSGDTDLDRRLLADAIRDILLEHAASHTDLSYT